MDLTNLEKQYYKRIPKRFKNTINNHIDSDFTQDMLKKAINYELSGIEKDLLFKIGKHKDCAYPHLYWLCTIYINPLTVIEYITNH